MADQLAFFDLPDDRDGIVFNGENAYNVEQWVRTRKGHASLIGTPTPYGVVQTVRIAQGDLTVQTGQTILFVDGEFTVE